MYHINRSIFIIEVSNALWSKQDSKTSCSQNYFCMAIVNCNELTLELNVFERIEGNKLFAIQFSTLVTYLCNIIHINYLTLPFNLFRRIVMYLSKERVKFQIQCTSLLDRLFASTFP